MVIKRPDVWAGSVQVEKVTLQDLVALSAWAIQGAEWPEVWSQRGVIAIGYLATVGSILGFLLFYYALKRLAAGQMALINLVTPMTALWVGHAINNEQVYDGMLWGTAAILLGLVAYQWSTVAGLIQRLSRR